MALYRGRSNCHVTCVFFLNLIVVLLYVALGHKADGEGEQDDDERQRFPRLPMGKTGENGG